MRPTEHNQIEILSLQRLGFLENLLSACHSAGKFPCHRRVRRQRVVERGRVLVHQVRVLRAPSPTKVLNLHANV